MLNQLIGMLHLLMMHTNQSSDRIRELPKSQRSLFHNARRFLRLGQREDCLRLQHLKNYFLHSSKSRLQYNNNRAFPQMLLRACKSCSFHSQLLLLPKLKRLYFDTIGNSTPCHKLQQIRHLLWHFDKDFVLQNWFLLRYLGDSKKCYLDKNQMHFQGPH